MTQPAPDRSAIANRIRTLRRTRELSLQRLAKEAGISAGYLSEVERGRSAISGEKLVRLADTLGVTVDYVLSGRETTQTATGSTAISIPPGLSAAAEVLELSFADTIRLLAGKDSLVARRSATAEHEWTQAHWVEFYKKVKQFL